MPTGGDESSQEILLVNDRHILILMTVSFMHGIEVTLFTRRQVLVVVVVGLVASAGTAAAVSILIKDPHPITSAEGTLSSSPVTIDSQSLTYAGTNATGVDVVVNNTDASSHTVDLHFAIRKSDGTLVESTTKTSINVNTSSTKSVTWTFSTERTVDTFAQVEITVEQTS